MMQFATIASFLVLLCGFFGTIAATNDFNETFREGTKDSFYTAHNRQISTCASGIDFKSVSTVLFSSKDDLGQAVEVKTSCPLINPFKPVVFYSHGYFSSLYTYNASVLFSRLVKKGYTVYGVNWADGGCYEEHSFGIKNFLVYPFSVKNTLVIGGYLAKQIKTVIDDCKVSLKNIILIGHSLGSHIVAYAAKELQKSGYGKPPLIIAIDPAAPLIKRKCEERFCKTDAERTVALHTSFVGLQFSAADLDLWFNNGVSQPICEQWKPPYMNHLVCSHDIPITYLANLLLPNCVYVGVPQRPRKLLPSLKRGCSCNTANCIYIDDKIFDKNDKTTGDYCVSVSSTYPYCTKRELFGCK